MNTSKLLMLANDLSLSTEQSYTLDTVIEFCPEILPTYIEYQDTFSNKEMAFYCAAAKYFGVGIIDAIIVFKCSINGVKTTYDLVRAIMNAVTEDNTKRRMTRA